MRERLFLAAPILLPRGIAVALASSGYPGYVIGRRDNGIQFGLYGSVPKLLAALTATLMAFVGRRSRAGVAVVAVVSSLASVVAVFLDFGLLRRPGTALT